jgi:hypothetical protein
MTWGRDKIPAPTVPEKSVKTELLIPPLDRPEKFLEAQDFSL